MVNGYFGYKTYTCCMQYLYSRQYLKGSIFAVQELSHHVKSGEYTSHTPITFGFCKTQSFLYMCQTLGHWRRIWFGVYLTGWISHIHAYMSLGAKQEWRKYWPLYVWYPYRICNLEETQQPARSKWFGVYQTDRPIAYIYPAALSQMEKEEILIT